MKNLIMGMVLVIIGLPGTAIFFPNLFQLILGGLPVLLILGGLLAVYLGYEEMAAEKEMEALPPLQDDTPDEDKQNEKTQNAEPAEIPSTERPQPSEAVSKPAIPQPPVPPEQEPVTAPALEKKEDRPPAFAGNTDTLVFHSLSCNFSKGKKCTVRFVTRDEAIDQGYKPCKVCHP